MRACLTVFAVVALISARSFAQEDEDDYYDDEDLHHLTDMPESSPDVVAVGLLPNNMDNELFTGTPTDAIVGIVNNGAAMMNVTSISGSINSPFDFSYYTQNQTVTQYNQILQEGEEFTFRYKFYPATDLDSVEYQLALTVFYENEEELFSETFFNKTVTFVHKPSEFMSGDMPVILGVGTLVGLLVLFAMSKASGSSGGAGSGFEPLRKRAGSAKTKANRKRRGSKKKN